MNPWSKSTISLPYKVERGKISFQCGTKEFKPKARQGKAIKPKAKTKNSWVPTQIKIIDWHDDTFK